jgi:hypothetical protein
VAGSGGFWGCMECTPDAHAVPASTTGIEQSSKQRTKKSIEVVLPCSKLDQHCEQGHVSPVPQPQTQLGGENRWVFTSNSLKPPKKRRCAHFSHILTKPCIVSSMQRFGACVVTVLLEWTGVCNSSSSIKTCVNCTVICLFDRVLAPITSTLSAVSLHQPRTTSQVRLLLALVTCNELSLMS